MDRFRLCRMHKVQEINIRGTGHAWEAHDKIMEHESISDCTVLRERPSIMG